MECTQKLECTQELYSTQTEKVCPEQIGFLGICGQTYPIVRGPNKIGRDPQICSIVLNKNSISRQHAVIIVQNGKELKLMDLGSANKTRLNNQCLTPYNQYPLSNGDTIQFGEQFGVFRLLEEESDLPMTQAIDIPETPVFSRGASRINKAAVTLIPESPELSDRDDSFIVPSQPKHHQFKNPSNNFVKSSGKTISIQPVGTNKIDNVFWNSSKKSTSFNLDDSTISLNSEPSNSKSTVNNINNNLHEMNTQMPIGSKDDNEDSIYSAATQLPEGVNFSPNIHNLETQIPVADSPNISITSKNLNYPENKENYNNIFNAETQMPFGKQNSLNTSHLTDSDEMLFNAETQIADAKESSKQHITDSDENIFEAETQLPNLKENEQQDDNVFTAETQNPAYDKDAIFCAATQLPTCADNPVFSADTQLPKCADNPVFSADTQLPRCEDNPVFSADTQLPKCEDNPVFSADTQLPTTSKESASVESKESASIESNSKNISNNIVDKSDDRILFDEIESETQSFLEGFESQPLLPQEDSPGDENVIPLSQSVKDDDEDEVQAKASKRVNRIDSDSTDIEDFTDLPTQKLLPKSDDDGDTTDCEDDIIIEPNKPKPPEFEELPTQIIGADVPNSPEKVADARKSPEIDFEDMPTQIIDVNAAVNKDVAFEDLGTQLIPERIENEIDDMATQVIPELPHDQQNPSSDTPPNQYSEEIVNPFKVPFSTPLKTKKKDTPKSTDDTYLKPSPSPKSPVKVVNLTEDDEQYYAATQDLYDDLCSQRESSPILVHPLTSKSKSVEGSLLKEKQIELINLAEEVVPSSDKGNKVEDRLPHLELSPAKKYVIADKSSSSDEGDEKVTNFVRSLSKTQINELIGVKTDVSGLKKAPSDPSDVEVTPKKVRSRKFMETELPDSQEIKTSVSFASKTLVTESSSDSEPEQNSEDQNTPILFRKKKRVRDAKIDLTKQFEAQALPTRVITRVRKPTAKIQDSFDETKKLSKSILKPKLLPEEDDVDKEIITENITRLRSKGEKKNGKDVTFDLTNVKTEEKKVKKGASNKKDEGKIKQEIETKAKGKVKAEKDVRKPKPLDKENDESLNSVTENSRTTRSARYSDKSKNDSIQSQLFEKLKVTRTTRQKRVETDSSPKDNDKIDISEDISCKEVTRKRGRPKKNEKIEDKIDLTIDLTEVPKRSYRKKVNDEKDKTDKPKRTQKKNDKIDLTENNVDVTEVSRMGIETETKRTRRQCGVKTNETESASKTRAKTCKPSENQSTVYNVSSESNGESPRARKRSAALNNDVPNPKRTRSAAAMSSNVSVTTLSSNTSSAVSSNNSSLRSTPARATKTQYVLFTAFPYEEVKGKLEKLGAVVVSDVISCTVVLTVQIKRTFKLLCAVGLGKPIVGPEWVQACNDCHMIVDPWLYIIKDEVTENRFQFSLSRTLSGKRNYLKGYNVSSTKSVMPTAPELKLIVECSGGTWKEGGPKWVCVSCNADRALWPTLRRRGATIVSSEFILSGVLRQRADVQGNILV